MRERVKPPMTGFTKKDTRVSEKNLLESMKPSKLQRTSLLESHQVEKIRMTQTDHIIEAKKPRLLFMNSILIF